MSGIDEKGAAPMRGNACVLLSGGLDSTACLHWTLAKYQDVRAVAFDYGQPHRDAELYAAQSLAERKGVPFERVILADALHSGLLRAVPENDPIGTGIHRAFVPGRNLVFLSLAMARACLWWPEGDLALVIGACLEDQAGFPDCTERFLSAAESALSASIARPVKICAPYARMPKARMIEDVRLRFESGLADLEVSWSCYAGKGPCGKCTPCVLRASAFASAGLTERCAAPKMTGGDVAREARLRG